MRNWEIGYSIFNIKQLIKKGIRSFYSLIKAVEVPQNWIAFNAILSEPNTLLMVDKSNTFIVELKIPLTNLAWGTHMELLLLRTN